MSSPVDCRDPRGLAPGDASIKKQHLDDIRNSLNREFPGSLGHPSLASQVQAGRLADWTTVPGSVLGVFDFDDGGVLFASGPESTFEQMRASFIASWERQSTGVVAASTNAPVAERVKTVLDAMEKCSTDAKTLSWYKKFYGQTPIGAPGYNGGGIWRDLVTGKRPPSVGGSISPQRQGAPWQGPGKEMLELPAVAGSPDWRRQEVLAQDNFPPNAWRCFDRSDGAQPTGLMGLAVTLSWEQAHWHRVYSDTPRYLDAPSLQHMMEFWNQVDCCCLRAKLGRKGYSDQYDAAQTHTDSVSHKVVTTPEPMSWKP